MNKLIRPIFMWGKRCAGVSQTPIAEAAQKFQISKHRNIMALYDLIPSIGPFGFISPNATIIGEVETAGSCVFWPGAVLRGDMNAIKLMNFVIVGERTVIHTAASLPNGMPAEVTIGNDVMIQNDCTLYSCSIGEKCFIGYKSVILEGARLEDGVVLAPKTVVPPGRVIPANQLWAGNPAQYVRDVEEKDLYQLNYIIHNQHNMAIQQKYEYLPYSSAYLQKENCQDDLDPELVAGSLPHENWFDPSEKL